MELTLYQVDAFTDKTFGGNPAAVCALGEWLPDETLRKIAEENNLSETAFFVREGNGFHIRWFTPTTEVDLCGHATLASAYVIFEHLGYSSDTMTFSSASGPLSVTKSKNLFVLDFPVWPHEKTALRNDIAEALGAHPVELYKGNDWVAVFEDQETVRTLSPDMHKLAQIKDARCIAATAPGKNGTDFVSRNFAPSLGIPEDPVTGSTHCILAPIWSEKLGKTKFKAEQISKRGGVLMCELQDDRVKIGGQAALYLKGTIYI